MEVVQVSDPAGIIGQTNYLNSPLITNTVTAPATSGSYRFTHWTLNGIRYNDDLGRSANPVSFTLYEDTLAVAHYLPATQDSDVDGLPDWYEVEYYASLINNAASDTDGDGFTLAQEYAQGTHPLVPDEFVAGGLARVRSSLLLMNLDFSPTYILVSDPPGFLGVTNVVTNGTVVVTSDLWEQSVSGYRFAFWDLNGVRQQDACGIALGSFSFTVTNDTVATAHYLPATQDSDADDVLDWFELVYYPDLSQSGGSDTDGDGFTLAQEFAQATIPTLFDEYVAGGIARTRSALVPMNLEGFPRYWLLSDPPGFVAVSNIVNSGTLITTPDLWNQSVSGYRFAYWDLNGVRQQDAYGIALGRLSFTVTNDTVATAHYLPATQDSDADGVPDWFELVYYPTLAEDSGSNTDGDGFTLGQEYAQSSQPTMPDEYVSGGIARARSAGNIAMDLQPFERPAFMLVNGVVSNLFLPYDGTPGVNGTDFGSNIAPALGDYDGDGDLDLFLTGSPGTLRVFQNIGTRYNLNLAERTINFAALASLCSAYTLPALALGDWSGDSAADVIIGGDGGTIRILSSPGHFNAPQTFAVNYAIASGSTAAIPALGDLNNDGRQDLLLLLDDGTVNLYTNTSNASVPFAASPAFVNLLPAAVGNGTGLSVADINYDGLPDVLASDIDGRIWEFWGGAGGGFTLMSKVWGGAGAGLTSRLTLTAADLDGDGDVDALAGTADGGVLELRDPRYAVPANLRAFGGANSIHLEWDPNQQSRIGGYNVYRSAPATNNFSRLNGSRVVVPRYDDMLPLAAVSNYYRVTAVSRVIYPGNSDPQYVESRPSEIAAAWVGGVTLTMPDYFGQPGSNTILQIATPLASGITGTNLEIRVTYNPLLLTPLTQVNPVLPSVENTPLTESLVVTNNGLAATGELVITGLGGGPITGQGTLFKINFRVSPSALVGSMATNAFTSVTLRDAAGNLVPVNATDAAIFTVANGYFPGDGDGDGVLSQADFSLALQLAVGKNEPTPEELAAFDLNGNGILDKDDAQIIRRWLQGKP